MGRIKGKDFSKDEKERAFDRIIDEYFSKSFGSMSKTNIDILFFSVYQEHCIESGKNSDDYSMAQELGISQGRIRSLKMNAELQYPRQEFNWKNQFAEYIKKAIYDKNKDMIKVMIPDVIVMNELRHYLEIKGWFDEYSLNPKLFQCRVDFFLDLCESLKDENENLLDEKNIKKIKQEKISADEKSAIGKIRKGNVKEGIMDLIGMGSITLLKEIISIINPVGFLGNAIVSMIGILPN